MTRIAAVVLGLGLALGGGGCLAVGARAHAGAVTDGQRTGVQVGLVLGMGLAIDERSVVLASAGAATGSPTVGVAGTVDYARLPEDHDGHGILWRAGLGGVIGVVDDPSVVGAHAAGVLVLRDVASTDPGHEKMGGGGMQRSVLGVGIEGGVGLASHLDDPDYRGVGASASLTVEYVLLMRMRL